MIKLSEIALIIVIVLVLILNSVVVVETPSSIHLATSLVTSFNYVEFPELSID